MRNSAKGVLHFLYPAILIVAAIFTGFLMYNSYWKEQPANYQNLKADVVISGKLVEDMVGDYVKVIVTKDGQDFKLNKRDKLYFSEMRKYKVSNVIFTSKHRLLECNLEYDGVLELFENPDTQQKYFPVKDLE